MNTNMKDIYTSDRRQPEKNVKSVFMCLFYSANRNGQI